MIDLGQLFHICSFISAVVHFINAYIIVGFFLLCIQMIGCSVKHGYTKLKYFLGHRVHMSNLVEKLYFIKAVALLRQLFLAGVLSGGEI